MLTCELQNGFHFPCLLHLIRLGELLAAACFNRNARMRVTGTFATFDLVRKVEKYWRQKHERLDKEGYGRHHMYHAPWCVG